MLVHRAVLLLSTALYCAGLSIADPAVAQEPTKLLRFPDLHGDQVVFTYAGDLWRASASGGTAIRLTSHPGLELFARFSPDGEWLAFTGQYDGDEQVYVMPAAGGVPRQLTFYPAAGPLSPRWGYDHQVYGWTPDGEKVLFRSLRDGWDLADTKLYTVDLEGGPVEALPMPFSGAGDFSPDGSKVVYSPLVRDFRHWKRYQGGWAQDLYIFDFENRTAERITDHPRSDRDPMWIGDEIYFTSDRSGTLNLYRFDPASGSTDQLTTSDVWDLRWPSADAVGGRIIYEKNGELEIFQLAKSDTTRLAIEVPDDGVASRPARVSAARQIEDIGLAPKGQRAVFAARGDIFTVPIEHGRTRNLTRSSGAHDREPAWSPDGKNIAFVSDLDGEEEIYLIDQGGQGEPQQLTDGSIGRYYGIEWSPDSQHLAFRNQAGKIFALALENRQQIEVADDAAPFGLDYTWSPDSRYLAFSLTGPNAFNSLHIWSREDGQLHRITGEMFNEFAPAWDPEGKYLFYLSDREFTPQLGSFEFNYVVNRETYIYALALRRDVPHPFPPRSDEVDLENKEEDDEEKEKDGENRKIKKSAAKNNTAKDNKAKDSAETPGEGERKDLGIDFEGLADRVARVPLPAANYQFLAAVPEHLLYAHGGAFYYGRAREQETGLYVYSFEDRKETQLVSTLDDGALSPDGTKLLIGQGSSYSLIEAGPGGKDAGKPVSTVGLQVDLTPHEEWAQIFGEVWRRFRDFFYVENLHGYDWQSLMEQYRPLLAHVGHRSDLNYLMSEMIAELNVSHAYVSGGSYKTPDRPEAALLGARFEIDESSRRYRISKIFSGHNQEELYRSPLTEVGVDVEVGDYVLAINGRSLEAPDNPFRLLRHAGGMPVELMVSDKPSLEGAKRVVINPIREEDSLIYLQWIEQNLQQVDEATDGRVGYLHLPNMGTDGIREFIKWFYGQVRKEGLIIDVRSNGGGNVSQMLIERLSRQLLMVDFERNVDFPETYPGVTFYGHMVCLLDEDTASDGDQFAYVFREAGLGPLIGKRSWGGVVGIYGREPLIDGGSVSVPEAGSGDPQGRWVIEGHGVDPDIEVDNDPAEILKGRDQQLEKAIEVVLDKIEKEPRKLPERPADPIKTD